MGYSHFTAGGTHQGASLWSRTGLALLVGSMRTPVLSFAEATVPTFSNHPGCQGALGREAAQGLWKAASLVANWIRPTAEEKGPATHTAQTRRQWSSAAPLPPDLSPPEVGRKAGSAALWWCCMEIWPHNCLQSHCPPQFLTP